MCVLSSCLSCHYRNSSDWAHATRREAALQQYQLRQMYIEMVLERGGIPLPEVLRLIPYLVKVWNVTKGKLKALNDIVSTEGGFQKIII